MANFLSVGSSDRRSKCARTLHHLATRGTRLGLVLGLEFARCNTPHHFTLGVATHLKTVIPYTPAIGRLDPMKEAPSNEGAFLVSATPPSGSLGGGILVMVGAWSSGQLAVLPVARRGLVR